MGRPALARLESLFLRTSFFDKPEIGRANHSSHSQAVLRFGSGGTWLGSNVSLTLDPQPSALSRLDSRVVELPKSRGAMGLHCRPTRSFCYHKALGDRLLLPMCFLTSSRRRNRRSCRSRRSLHYYGQHLGQSFRPNQDRCEAARTGERNEWMKNERALIQ